MHDYVLSVRLALGFYYTRIDGCKLSLDYVGIALMWIYGLWSANRKKTPTVIFMIAYMHARCLLLCLYLCVDQIIWTISCQSFSTSLWTLLPFS